MANVLVIDDDTDLAEMVTMMLNRAGMQVESIAAAETIIETIGRFRPDIILMDIYLGDQDGRDISRSLKTSETFGSIPIILYSAGHITALSVQESLADDFIAKPFGMEQMVSKIRSFIS